MDAQDWKDYKEEMRAKSQQRCEDIKNELTEFCKENNLSFFELKPWHFRIQKTIEKAIDYFPTTSSFTIVGSGRFSHIQLSKLKETLINSL